LIAEWKAFDPYAKFKNLNPARALDRMQLKLI
jgi:hypothetical protein